MYMLLHFVYRVILPFRVVYKHSTYVNGQVRSCTSMRHGKREERNKNYKLESGKGEGVLRSVMLFNRPPRERNKFFWMEIATTILRTDHDLAKLYTKTILLLLSLIHI